MANQEPEVRQRVKGGVFCLAPGCSNRFDKKTTIQFHRLPLKRPAILSLWLTAIKRKDPPVNAHARVCSGHFLPEDYVEEKFFDESGALASRRTKRLHLEAVPSVFDFSGYSCGSTDRPAHYTCPELVESRKKRAQRREKQRTVTSGNDDKLIFSTDILYK